MPGLDVPVQAEFSSAGFLHALLLEASRPDGRIEDVLLRIFEVARHLTGAGSAGGVVVFASHGSSRASAAEVWWWGEGEPGLSDRSDVVAEVRRTGEAVLCGDAGGAAAELWMPVVEGKHQVMAVVGLIALAQRRFSERDVSLLGGLSAAAVAGINRALLRKRLLSCGFEQDVVGVHPAFLDFERRIKQAALYSDEPVLVLGERGSGKELTAWAIHGWSRRSEGPFVPVLASGLADGMLADELFGHEKNAFTGAERERLGKFGAAHQGSLFFDEVGDLPSAVQSSLMRIIGRGELSRLGRDLPLKIDVRVIAATNRDFEELMRQGSFRRDLYDRLRVVELVVPPLRARRTDIPLLADAFMRKLCRRMGRRTLMAGEGCCASCGRRQTFRCAEDGFVEALMAYDWPGNIRELENVLTFLVAEAPDDVLRLDHLPAHIRNGSRPQAPRSQAQPQLADDLTLEQAVRQHILRILHLTGSNQSEAARILGVPLSTMRHKMKKLGIGIRRTS